MYGSYAPKASCAANIAFITVTIIGACFGSSVSVRELVLVWYFCVCLCCSGISVTSDTIEESPTVAAAQSAGAVFYTTLTLSPWRPQSAGLFVSGSIFIYCTYLCWGALSSQPAGDCVPQNATALPIQVLASNSKLACCQFSSTSMICVSSPLPRFLASLAGLLTFATAACAWHAHSIPFHS